MVSDQTSGRLTRRAFAASVGAAGLAGATGAPARSAAPPMTSTSTITLVGPAPTPISLNVNGADRMLTIEPRVTLLDALRERLSLTGTKKGCDQGTCGACTVLVDGRRVNACLTLAMVAVGKKIETIEGLANGNDLHPVQRAFLEHDGFQCGYCTPGQIMSAVGLIAEKRTGSDAEIREHMSGNICRCGAYPNIVDAVKTAAGLA